MVAHTPALPHHAWIRAQKWDQLSMVSTVYTLSMGTYWVRRVQVLTRSLPLRPFAWSGAVHKHLDQLHDV